MITPPSSNHHTSWLTFLQVLHLQCLLPSVCACVCGCFYIIQITSCSHPVDAAFEKQGIGRSHPLLCPLRFPSESAYKRSPFARIVGSDFCEILLRVPTVLHCQFSHNGLWRDPAQSMLDYACNGNCIQFSHCIYMLPCALVHVFLAE